MNEEEMIQSRTCGILLKEETESLVLTRARTTVRLGGEERIVLHSHRIPVQETEKKSGTVNRTVNFMVIREKVLLDHKIVGKETRDVLWREKHTSTCTWRNRNCAP